jgi:hypothetical protein
MTNEPEFLPIESSQIIAKPGLRTTEFWLTLAVIVAASVLLALGKIDQAAWLTAAGVSSGGYAISRGLAKL